MADQGPTVIPEFLSLLDASEEHPHLMNGIRNAFKRLRPQATWVAPKLLAMIHKGPSKYLDEWDSRIRWLVTLRLMGVEEENLQPEFQHEKNKVAARIRDVVEKNVREYLRDKR
jgi:hypothetical protein